MDLGSLLRVIMRRWLVVLIGAILTMGLAALAYTQIPPRYQSSARMLLLLPPDARGEDLIGSPFLYLPNGLNVLARIVSITPTSSDFEERLYAEGFVSQYEVGVDNASPTVTLSVEGSDPQNVVATRNRLIQVINEELLRIQQQEKAPPQQIAHTRVYAAESVPEQIGGDRARGVLAIGGAGAVITLLATFLIDRLSQVRKAPRGRRAVREPGEKSIDDHDDGDVTPEAGGDASVPDDTDESAFVSAANSLASPKSPSRRSIRRRGAVEDGAKV